jgi:hypothetical protein
LDLDPYLDANPYPDSQSDLYTDPHMDTYDHLDPDLD